MRKHPQAPADLKVPCPRSIGDVCTPGVTLSGPQVLLSNDLEPDGVAPVCSTGLQIPNDGVEIDAGSYVELPPGLAFSTHCLHLHGLTACPATTPAYSILIMRVMVPGRTKPLLVSIGLAGNGLIARAILYSLNAA